MDWYKFNGCLVDGAGVLTSVVVVARLASTDSLNSWVPRRVSLRPRYHSVWLFIAELSVLFERPTA